MKTYQDLFNDTLTRIRYAVSVTVEDESLLMRAICKAMYDFSDELIESGIIKDRGQTGNDTRN